MMVSVALWEMYDLVFLELDPYYVFIVSQPYGSVILNLWSTPVFLYFLLTQILILVLFCWNMHQNSGSAAQRFRLKLQIKNGMCDVYKKTQFKLDSPICLRLTGGKGERGAS